MIRLFGRLNLQRWLELHAILKHDSAEFYDEHRDMMISRRVYEAEQHEVWNCMDMTDREDAMILVLSAE